jgi:hypothetical protein
VALPAPRPRRRRRVVRRLEGRVPGALALGPRGARHAHQRQLRVVVRLEPVRAGRNGLARGAVRALHGLECGGPGLQSPRLPEGRQLQRPAAGTDPRAPPHAAGGPARRRALEAHLLGGGAGRDHRQPGGRARRARRRRRPVRAGPQRRLRRQHGRRPALLPADRRPADRLHGPDRRPGGGRNHHPGHSTHRRHLGRLVPLRQPDPVGVQSRGRPDPRRPLRARASPAPTRRWRSRPAR